jgi:hypothetical protein
MRTLTISRIRLALVAAIATVLIQPVLKAQTPEGPVTANIPFAFQIGSYHYAPGKYVVQMQTDHVMLVQGASGPSCMLLVNRDIARHPSAKSMLVFHRYGNHYFLSELHIAGNQESLKAARSKAERTAQQEEEASNRNPNRNESSNAEVALLDPVR